MYINSIKIKNYRNYEDFYMKFKEGLNVIIGANNARKTNLLHAINLLKDLNIEIDDFNKNNILKKYMNDYKKEAPKNEYEVQDKLENLFIANNMDKGLDYDRETGKFKFSGKEYIPDFVIPKYELCIEVKFIKDISRKSKMIEEINADITAYSKKYKNILFIIYDLGIIRDETEIKRDIEDIDGVNILVVKH